MALTLTEAQELIANGSAHSWISEFIFKAKLLQHRGRMEQVDSITQRNLDLDLVAALALEAVIKTPDGRRSLNLKRAARGKDFAAEDYLPNGQVIDLVLAFHRCDIDKDATLKRLADIVCTSHVTPDQRTLQRLLFEMEDTVVGAMKKAKVILATLNSDPSDANAELFMRAAFTGRYDDVR